MQVEGGREAGKGQCGGNQEKRGGSHVSAGGGFWHGISFGLELDGGLSGPGVLPGMRRRRGVSCGWGWIGSVKAANKMVVCCNFGKRDWLADGNKAIMNYLNGFNPSVAVRSEKCHSR